MIDPEKDGYDHINIYSKAQTELGRFLTNFAYCPIETEDGSFLSIEGYWYWLGCKDDRLRKAIGWNAKKLGREIGAPDWQDDEEFKRKICEAITIKLESPTAKKIIKSSSHLLDLPLTHYYVYGGKVVEPKEGKWIIDHINECLRTMFCSDCGATEELSTGPDPYVEDVCNKIVIVTLCANCYHESCQDI